MNKYTNSFDGKTLKLIAIVTMLIDHVGLVIFYRALFLPANGAGLPSASFYMNAYYVCRMIGRVAFPIFAFLLVEGFLHTHDKRKYLVNLSIFAVISQLPYYLAICGDGISYAHLNVMVTLVLGVLMMWGIEKVREYSVSNSCKQEGNERTCTNKRRFLPSSEKIARHILCNPVLQVIPVAVTCAAAYFLDVDYGIIGIVVIAILYFFRYQMKTAMILAAAALIVYDLSELPVIISFMLIYLYNGKRGKQNKYFFYVFYPAHLLVLYLIYRILVM